MSHVVKSFRGIEVLDIANNRILRKGKWKQLVRLDISNYSGLLNRNSLNVFGIRRLVKNEHPNLFTIYLSTVILTRW